MVPGPSFNYYMCKIWMEEFNRTQLKGLKRMRIKCLCFFEQEIRGEAWQFNDSAICFVNGQLQGGPQQFIDWAAETYKYEDYRPPALYQTLTEEAYKTCLNKQNVSSAITLFLPMLSADNIYKQCGSKLTTVDPQERSTWRSGVRPATRAASQLPGKGPTDLDDAPAR